MKRAAVTGLLVLMAQILLCVLLVPRKAPPSGMDKPGGESAPGDGLRQVRLLLEDEGVQTVSLADYLWGVVAAEMPASFEQQALCAQAVAARTYWARLCLGEKHPGADICTQSSCCQAYISRDRAMENWGKNAQEYAARITAAVEQTDGLVVTSQGQPIQALFFSSAPGSTVDAQAVWGQAVPYLVSVDSPEGEEVPNYRSQLSIATGRFRELALQTWPEADLSGPVSGWLSDFVWEPSGTVNTVRVGGVTVKGGQVRKLLGLRSACFTVSEADGILTFHVTGYGHGVGMSQYGANAMARQGKDFREILCWYYTGAQIETLE